jgi:hypothetical protein
MAVGQNTTDVATNVGGIAQLNEEKKKQTLQRMAQGAQGAPQGPQMAPQAPPQGATQMAASGGIIMQGAPNLQRMAGGGIVGFDPGGEVERIPDAKQLERLGITEAEWLGLTRAEKRNLLPPVANEPGVWDSIKNAFSGSSPRGVPENVVQSPRPPFRTDVDDPGQAPPIDRNEQFKRKILGPAPVVQPPAQAPAQVRQSVGPFEGYEGDLTGIDAMLTARAKQQPSTNTVNPQLGGGIPTANIAGDAFDISATRAGKLIGRDPKAAQRAAMLERYKAANIEAENLRKKTELPDTFAFSGGTGFGAGAVEVANRRSKLASAKDARLRNELGLEEINIKGDVDIAGKQVTAGESAAKAALENSSRKELNRLKEAATASTSMTGARKNLTNIVKAIADLKQKNLEAVDKALANRVDLLKLKKAAADGEPEAIKQLEDIYKKAEEKASVKTKQILIELEALRTNVQNRIAGFGKATLKSKS